MQHCSDRITEEEHQQLFDSNWGSGQSEAQRQLLKDIIDMYKRDGKKNVNKFHLIERPTNSGAQDYVHQQTTWQKVMELCMPLTDIK